MRPVDFQALLQRWEDKEDREFFRFGVLAQILIKVFGGKDKDWRKIYGVRDRTAAPKVDVDQTIEAQYLKGNVPEDVYQLYLKQKDKDKK